MPRARPRSDITGARGSRARPKRTAASRDAASISRSDSTDATHAAPCPQAIGGEHVVGTASEPRGEGEGAFTPQRGFRDEGHGRQLPGPGRAGMEREVTPLD